MRRRRRGALTAIATLLAAALGASAAVGAPGTIATVAGTGAYGSAGDGGPATSATLRAPRTVAFLPDGSYLVPEFRGNRVRRVAPDGTITRVAGTGAAGYAGDGGPATSALFRGITDVAATPDGGYLLVDELNGVVRKVSAGGVVRTVAGTGTRACPAA